MYWRSFCVCREQITLRIYIQWRYLVFFPSNVYLRESTNHAISYTVMRWHGWMSFVHICFSWNCTIQFCLSFPFFAWYKKKETPIFIRHNPFTGYFFPLPFLGFFPSMSQYFCSIDIVRIHHVFSLLVYIIFPFSSDPSLIYRFMYGYL
jgi:hypothetical protein